MALRFSSEVIGSEAERERLRNLQDRLGGGLSADGAGPAVLGELGDINAERFRTEGFGKWPPLSESTVRRRRAALRSGRFSRGHHYAQAPASGVTAEGPVLVWSGALRSAMSEPVGAGRGNALVIMRPDVLKAGTQLQYQNFLIGNRDLGELLPDHRRRLTETYQAVLGAED